MLEDAFVSFVGQFPIPLRHGLTIAELARLFNEHFALGAPLDVVEMEGWRRAMHHDETGLAWVMPSPNLPTLDSAVVYPGMVLLEGTNLSEGRGTTRPFELCGAPWIDSEALVAALDAAPLPGVRFRPVFFEPTFQKHAGRRCGGCQLHVVDRAAFRPIETAVALLEAFRRLDPAAFAWRTPPYEYETEKMPIDILYGSDALRRLVEADTPPDVVAGTWQPALERFLEIRSRVLLYLTTDASHERTEASHAMTRRVSRCNPRPRTVHHEAHEAHEAQRPLVRARNARKPPRTRDGHRAHRVSITPFASSWLPYVDTAAA